MADELLDEIIAATVPTDPDAPSVDERAVVHERRRDEIRAWVESVKPRVDASTPEGRRLRRVLDEAVRNADRLVRAHRASLTDLVAIRRAAEVMKERSDGG
jgi:hypothetical protein